MSEEQTRTPWKLMTEEQLKELSEKKDLSLWNLTLAYYLARNCKLKFEEASRIIACSRKIQNYSILISI